jgi:hypothetical protein
MKSETPEQRIAAIAVEITREAFNRRLLASGEAGEELKLIIAAALRDCTPIAAPVLFEISHAQFLASCDSATAAPAPQAPTERRSGNSRLVGRPLDEDGRIEFRAAAPLAPEPQYHLAKNKSTPENREFWAHVEKVAAEVRAPEPPQSPRTWTDSFTEEELKNIAELAEQPAAKPPSPARQQEAPEGQE